MSLFRRSASSRTIVLSLLLLGCSPYSELSVVEEERFDSSGSERIFSNVEKEELYRAEIELYDRYFTGLFLIKTIADREYRTVFMSEMGVKFFDLSFHEDHFEVKQAFEKIDRKVLTSRIRKDLRLLLMPSIKDEQMGKRFGAEDKEIWSFDAGPDGTFYYHSKEGQLQKGEIVDGLRKRKKVSMELSWGKGELPEKIRFEHEDIDLTLSLTRVKEDG